MHRLARRIAVAFENPKSELWFPELTHDLALHEWNRLHRDIGITPGTYGTARVLSRCTCAPSPTVSIKKGSQLSSSSDISIEVVQQEWAESYCRNGVSFYSIEEIQNTSVFPCVVEAIAIINQNPSLMRTVGTLARSLHLIKPPDADYDVSFSEPHIPFSIFVSVPETRVPNDAVRVAEAIVHETMHLQLTLIERISVLIRGNDDPKYYSPWRQERRTAQGLLHALYVFVVIDRFLSELRVSGKYELERRKKIAEEITQVHSLKSCPDFSPVGKVLVRRLLGGSNGINFDLRAL
jgi:hypothetical protein